MIRYVLALAALIAMPAAFTQATVYEIDHAHSSIEFKIRHLVGKTRGSFKNFSGTLEYDAKKPSKSKVEITVEISTHSLDTHNAKRDAHLVSPDFFDAKQYPTMQFKSKKVKKSGKDKLKVEGELTLLGKTKPATLEVTVNGVEKSPWGQTVAGFSASAKINREDYGMKWNKTLKDSGKLMIGKNVYISIEIEAVKAEKKEKAKKSKKTNAKSGSKK